VLCCYRFCGAKQTRQPQCMNPTHMPEHGMQPSGRLVVVSGLRQGPPSQVPSGVRPHASVCRRIVPDLRGIRLHRGKRGSGATVYILMASPLLLRKCESLAVATSTTLAPAMPRMCPTQQASAEAEGGDPRNPVQDSHPAEDGGTACTSALRSSNKSLRQAKVRGRAGSVILTEAPYIVG